MSMQFNMYNVCQTCYFNNVLQTSLKKNWYFQFTLGISNKILGSHNNFEITLQNGKSNTYLK